MSEDIENLRLSDIEILEDMKSRTYLALIGEGKDAKVGDLLKIIELKNKLSISGQAEKKFWDMINEARQKGLSSKKGRKPRKKSKTS